MIRNETHRRHVVMNAELLEEQIEEFMIDSDGFAPEARVLEGQLRALRAQIDEYDTFHAMRQRRELPSLIAAFDPQTDLHRASDVLYALRELSGRKQEEFAADCGVSQSYVSKWEQPDETGHHFDDLAKTTRSCGYQMLPVLIRNAGFFEPGAPARIHFDAVVATYGWNAKPAERFRSYLERLRTTAGCHSVVCYLWDERCNYLRLFHAAGVDDEFLTAPLAFRDSVPYQALVGGFEEEGDPDGGMTMGVVPRSAKQSSVFAGEQGLDASFYVVLPESELRGVVFVNFTSPVDTDIQVDPTLRAVRSGCGLVLSEVQGIEQLLEDTTLPDISGVPGVLGIAFASFVSDVRRWEPAVDSLDDLAASILSHLEIENAFCTIHVLLDDADLAICGAAPVSATHACRMPVTGPKGVVVSAYQTRGPIYARDLTERRWACKHVTLPVTCFDDPPRSELAIPMITKDGLRLGVINLESPEAHAFTEHDRWALVQVAQAIAATYQSAKAVHRVSEGIHQVRRSVSRLVRDSVGGLEPSAELARVLFGASAVLVARFDWQDRRFLVPCAISQGRSGPRLSRELDLNQDEQSLALVRRIGLRNETQAVQTIESPCEAKGLICKLAKENGLNGRWIGTRVWGRTSVRTEGIMWLAYSADAPEQAAAAEISGFSELMGVIMSLNRREMMLGA